MRKTIVHAIGAFIAGGAEKFVCNLSIEMANTSNVIVLALSDRDDAAGRAMKLELGKAGVQYESGPTKKPGVATLLWLLKKLYSLDADVIHLHTPNTELAYYICSIFYHKGRGQLFRTIHNTQVAHNRLTRFAFDHNEPRVSIACGQTTFDIYKDLIAEDLMVIDNGVSFDWPVRNAEDRDKYRDLLGLAKDKIHFICVGSMSGQDVGTAQKAHDFIIDCWMQEKMGSKDCELHFVGDGNLRPDLESLSKSDQSIVFHGVQDNIFKWLLACDNYLMVSRYEGLPIAGIEAISTGIRCIFTDIKPLKELDPPNVLWVDVDNRVSLAQQLQASVSSDYIVDMRKIESFRDKYSIERASTKYLSIYSQ